MRIVRSIDELLRLSRDPAVNGIARRARVQLEIPQLTRHQQIAAQSRLNRMQSRCGCNAGAIALLATLVVGGMQVNAGTGGLSWRFASQSAGVLVAAFCIGFVAKFATLAVTRWQFAYECRVQHRTLEQLIGGADDVSLHAVGR